MVRPILALERLTFLVPEGQVGYRYGEMGAELETMDYLEFIARVTSHIPDKGQVMVREAPAASGRFPGVAMGGRPSGRVLPRSPGRMFFMTESEPAERGASGQRPPGRRSQPFSPIRPAIRPFRP
jgi:hypothetical protein